MKFDSTPSQKKVASVGAAFEQASSEQTPLETNDEYGPDFKRVPFGSPQAQLASTGIPGYHLHWINDWHPTMTDRLQQALNAGYRFVTRKEVDHTPAFGAPTTSLDGERVSRVVGTRPDGAPITSYLMKVPEEWHQEHMDAIEKRAKQVDAAIRRGPQGAKVENGYLPKGDRITLRQKLDRNNLEGDIE